MFLLKMKINDTFIALPVYKAARQRNRIVNLHLRPRTTTFGDIPHQTIFFSDLSQDSLVERCFTWNGYQKENMSRSAGTCDAVLNFNIG